MPGWMCQHEVVMVEVTRQGQARAGVGVTGQGKPCPYIYDEAFEYCQRARAGILLALALSF